jgi:hypothetical protein
MNYLSKEDQKNLFIKQIEYLQASIDGIEPVKAILLKNDNKVLNKRIHDQMPENYTLKTGRYNEGLEFCDFNNRSIKSTTKDSFGYSSTIYITHESVTFGKYTGIDTNIDFVSADNRLIAANLIKMIDERVIAIKALIINMKSDIAKIPEYESKKAALIAAVKQYNDSFTNYYTKEYFNLNIDIKTY